MKLALVLAVLVLVSPQDPAKDRLEKSPRHLEWITVKHGERTVHCFIAYPEVKEKAPAIVLIHEIFGLSDWMRSMTDQLAERGYIAIAPDLLSGMGPKGGKTSDFESGDAVRAAIGKLPPEQVTADLNAVCDFAKKDSACNGKVAVGGFCWGGSQTFRFATNRKDLAAGYVFYGGGVVKEEEIARIECPIYGFYAENDNRVNSTISKSEELMKAAKKTFEPATYKGGGHGFMRAGEMNPKDEGNVKAREEAWKRWEELLKKLKN
jgi:carboxymethylenebutenolidase